MTRLEAQEQMGTVVDDYLEEEGEKVIEMIYDDFEQKTCQNCKHYKDTDEFFGGKCTLKNVNMDKDDGCLKGWESVE